MTHRCSKSCESSFQLVGGSSIFPFPVHSIVNDRKIAVSQKLLKIVALCSMTHCTHSRHHSYRRCANPNRDLGVLISQPYWPSGPLPHPFAALFRYASAGNRGAARTAGAQSSFCKYFSVCTTDLISAVNEFYGQRIYNGQRES